jgi:predicted acyl esterase
MPIEVTDVVIATADGERLAATLYVPDAAMHTAPYPAVMEALPYRKDDITESYGSTYRTFAEAGFAVLRVDLRGTGSSSGIATDEYPDVERTDLRTAIEWLTAQRWSNGRVGMFGTSYSGFNSLQMAAEIGALGIPGLRAVVATYATDDRYTDDVHWCGGVLRAIDLIDYPLYMVAMNALPPVPAVFGEGWRDEWRRRIDGNPPWMTEWLDHRTDGPTWRRGSIRLGPDGEGYERMGCPTMLIVGWADGYRNNSFRVVEQYQRNGLPWRLLAGPWVHKSPDRARPGPNVNDDVEVLAFFGEHLRDDPPSPAARGQVFVRAPVEPEPDLELHPGRWIDLDEWVPPAPTVWRSARTGVDAIAVRGDVGVAAWNSCGGGLPWGQPLDQRNDNARSIVHDWSFASHVGAGAGDTVTELIGHARARFRVRTDRTFGQVSIKLCDVFPDGTSTLITRGMLDLTHLGCWPADDRGVVGRAPSPLTPGEWIDLDLAFEATTWTLAPGHVLRLAIAGTDWPNCWPPAGPVTLEVDAATVELALPLTTSLSASTHTFVPGEGPSAHEADGVTWRIEHDVIARETRVATRYGDTYDGVHGVVTTDEYRGELGVSTTNPANAWASGTSSYRMTWPEASVRTEATLAVESDEHGFDVTIDLRVWDGDEQIAERRWTRQLPR